ncbi:uncharacterized protein BXIN_0991 [Babesia sp. Xinjiang]|uniref:uncharacterized protein n=1 Tax=Babesia sp. Xinjiang TaxID=462227 RepID=UPI000A2358AF|nr:uncharacterized protein BXIN_0991 [Babesia sp. Xinjiang]ORM42204.1 hypothetical protein BXIN_0991 [Babesia sp. Xinjiang]
MLFSGILVAVALGGYVQQGSCALTQHVPAALTPYVVPGSLGEGEHGGTVILDTAAEGISRLPFVEIAGGRAFHYKDPQDFHENDLKRRQESLQKAPGYETDACETMRNF